jgi:serine/threonine-protein kinase
VVALNQAIGLAPEQVGFWADLGMAHTIQAGYALDHEQDPQPSLGLAEHAIEKALQVDPKNAQSWQYLGETRGLQARLRARHGQGKAAEFAAAADAYQKAVDLEPEKQDIRIAFGHFCRAWAMFQRDAGETPPPSLRRGLDLANKALDIRHDWPDGLVLRGSLILLQAQLSTVPAERRALAHQALADLVKAQDLHPALGKAWDGQTTLARQISGAP